MRPDSTDRARRELLLDRLDRCDRSAGVGLLAVDLIDRTGIHFTGAARAGNASLTRRPPPPSSGAATP